ncbi:MAG: hypothetical protein IPK07_15725 [Deltaproteobacteria bacterium]|nr:hypothetical protein [Deltaproteobacteria bacterium]
MVIAAPRPGDHEVGGDVEVAGGACVLTRACDGERVGRGVEEMVSSPAEPAAQPSTGASPVRGEDRLAQRAGPFGPEARRVVAVAWTS